MFWSPRCYYCHQSFNRFCKLDTVEKRCQKCPHFHSDILAREIQGRKSEGLKFESRNLIRDSAAASSTTGPKKEEKNLGTCHRILFFFSFIFSLSSFSLFLFVGEMLQMLPAEILTQIAFQLPSRNDVRRFRLVNSAFAAASFSALFRSIQVINTMECFEKLQNLAKSPSGSLGVAKHITLYHGVWPEISSKEHKARRLATRDTSSS